MGRIYSAVQAFLEKAQIKFDAFEEDGIFRFGYRSKAFQWFCLIEVREAQEQLIISSVIPEAVAERHRPQIAELLTRINFGLAVGNFEMDYQHTGRIRFRTSINFEGSEVAVSLLQALLGSNLSSTARYFAIIQQVAQGAIAPAAALQQLREEN